MFPHLLTEVVFFSTLSLHSWVCSWHTAPPVLDQSRFGGLAVHVRAGLCWIVFVYVVSEAIIFEIKGTDIC